MPDYAHRRPPEPVLPAGAHEAGVEQGPIPEHLLPAKEEAERVARKRAAELARERQRRFGRMVPRSELRSRDARFIEGEAQGVGDAEGGFSEVESGGG